MSAFRRLLGMLAPFHWRVVLTVLLGAILVASNIGLLGMAAYLIAAAALKPLLVTLTLPIVVVRFASVVRATTRYAERLTSHSLTFRILTRLRAHVYRRLSLLVPAGLHAYRSGDLLTRLVADVDELQHFYLRVVEPFLVVGVVAVLTSGLFALFSPALAWTALAFLVLGSAGVPLVARWLSRDVGARQLTTRAELNTWLVDGIQGVQDILALSRESTFLSQLAEHDKAIAHWDRRIALMRGVEQGLNDLITSLAVWTILLISIPLVSAHVIGGIYLGFLAVVMMASFEAVQPVGPALHTLDRALTAGRRVFDIVDRPPAVTEPAQTVRAPSGVPRTRPSALSLAFERVSFTYPPASDLESGGLGVALADVTFSVPAGGRIAIVGPSGAGKSTLARLAVRFYDPTSGTVHLQGDDIRSVALHEVRAAFGVVAQDTYVFSDTLRRNVLLGRPTATDDEIVTALELAQLGDLIRQLPRGLDTWVGEHGLRLSGGERQRLAIARTLLKDAPILLLDEPTANLDTQTEGELLDALDTIAQGRTTVLITHRLRRMERMDEILVLDAGRIVERGRHETLLAGNTLYRHMFDLQNGMLASRDLVKETPYG